MWVEDGKPVQDDSSSYFSLFTIITMGFIHPGWLARFPQPSTTMCIKLTSNTLIGALDKEMGCQMDGSDGSWGGTKAATGYSSRSMMDDWNLKMNGGNEDVWKTTPPSTLEREIPIMGTVLAMSTEGGSYMLCFYYIQKLSSRI